MPRKPRTWDQFPEQYFQWIDHFADAAPPAHRVSIPCSSTKAARTLRMDIYRLWSTLRDQCPMGVLDCDPVLFRYARLCNYISVTIDERKDDAPTTLTFRMRPGCEMPTREYLTAPRSRNALLNAPSDGAPRNRHANTPSLSSQDGKLHFPSREAYEQYCRDECELGSSDYIIDEA